MYTKQAACTDVLLDGHHLRSGRFDEASVGVADEVRERQLSTDHLLRHDAWNKLSISKFKEVNLTGCPFPRALPAPWWQYIWYKSDAATVTLFTCISIKTWS